MAPVDNEVNEGTGAAATVEDIIEILDDDAVSDETTEGEPPKKVAKEDKEDKDEEVELEETETETDELEFVNVPRKKEILKEFPEIFKKFPGMERALYKEAQYAELFPTMQEAKDAKEELRNLKGVESEIMNGDIESVLRSVK